MPYNVLIDKEKEEAERKSLADRIRAKTGASGELTWGKGFEDAVDSIQSGGGDDFVCPVIDDVIYTTEDEEPAISKKVDIGKSITGSTLLAVIWFRKEMPKVSAGWNYSGRGALNTDENDNQEIAVYTRIADGQDSSITAQYSSGQSERMYIIVVSLIGCKSSVKIHTVGKNNAPYQYVTRPFSNPGFLVAHTQYNREPVFKPSVYKRECFGRMSMQFETLNPFQIEILTEAPSDLPTSAMYIELFPEKVNIPSGYNEIISKAERDSETLQIIEGVM